VADPDVPPPLAHLPPPTELPEPSGVAPLAEADDEPPPLAEADDEPPLPEEAHAAVASAAAASTVPVEAGPDQTLHIRFADAPDERIVAAFAEIRTLIKARPGATPVVLHIPAGPGRSREMRLGIGIAYDADLVAEVGRSFGSLIELHLA
jgi:hypothetical protein